MSDLFFNDQFAWKANEWLIFAESGAKVHKTALVHFQPMSSLTFARKVEKHPFAILGQGVTIGPYAIIYAGCEIGNNTQVCPYAHIREGVKIGHDCIIGVSAKIGFDVIIGNDCQIMDDAHISGGSIIGDGCFISVHALMVNDDTPRGYNWKGITPVTLGNNVVVGAGVKLRPGIKVGDNATLAMGAVVTRDVAEGDMIKGERAKSSIEYEELKQRQYGLEMLRKNPIINANLWTKLEAK